MDAREESRGLARTPPETSVPASCVPDTHERVVNWYATRGGHSPGVEGMPEDVAQMLSRPQEPTYRSLVVNAGVLERDYPGQGVPNKVYQHVLRAQWPEDVELLYRVFMRWKPTVETLRVPDTLELSDELQGALTWGACHWGEDVLDEEEIEERVPSWAREFLLKMFEASITHPERKGTGAWFEVVGRLARESVAVKEIVCGLAPEWEGEPAELLGMERSLLQAEREDPDAG